MVGWITANNVIPLIVAYGCGIITSAVSIGFFVALYIIITKAGSKSSKRADIVTNNSEPLKPEDENSVRIKSFTWDKAV